MAYISIIVMFSSSLTVIYFKSDIDPVILAMVFQYTLNMNWALKDFFNGLSSVEMNLVGIQRCIQVTKVPSEKFDQPKINSLMPGLSWPQAGKIEFKDVVLRYRPGKETVLKSLSFTAEGG